MPLHTKPLLISEKYSSELDSEQPITVQEQPLSNSESSTDRKDTNIQCDLKASRRESTQKVEQCQNIQLLEPSIHESVSELNASETEIVDKIGNVSIQEDVRGVNVPLDLGTTFMEPDKVIT